MENHVKATSPKMTWMDVTCITTIPSWNEIIRHIQSFFIKRLKLMLSMRIGKPMCNIKKGTQVANIMETARLIV